MIIPWAKKSPVSDRFFSETTALFNLAIYLLKNILDTGIRHYTGKTRFPERI
jgi:hypothetical protein